MKLVRRLLLSLVLLFALATGARAQTQTVTEAGVAGQAAATNNIIPGGQYFPIGPVACDVGHYDTLSLQVNPTGTISGGVITFEGSNDAVNFQAIYFFDLSNDAASPVNNFTPATGVVRNFVGPLTTRYFRARISTPITGGGSVQSFSSFSTTPFASVQSFSTDPSGNITVVGQGTAGVPSGGVLSVQQPDLAITGQGSQTALNNNIILAVAGSGATSSAGFRSWSIQINVAAGTVTGGVVTFEGSNDGTNWFTVSVYDQASPLAPPVTIDTLVAATNRLFKGPLGVSNVRARISTGVTGTTTGIQAFTVLSMNTFFPEVVSVTGPSTAGAGVPPLGGVMVSGQSLNAVPSSALTNNRPAFLPISTDTQVIIHQDGSPENEWQASSGTTPLATNSSTQLQASQGAGIRSYVTGIQVWNNSATVSTTVSILDGASVIWTGYLPATTAALAVVPCIVEFRTPLKGTAATALNIQCGTTGSSIFYNVEGFKAN